MSIRRPTAIRYSGDMGLATKWLWFGKKMLIALTRQQEMGGWRLVNPISRKELNRENGDVIKFKVMYQKNRPFIFIEAIPAGVLEDVLFIYLHSVSADNVVSVHGWGPKSLDHKLFTIDLKLISATPEDIVSVEFSRFAPAFYPYLNADNTIKPWVSHVFFRSSQSAIEPPYGEYDLKFTPSADRFNISQNHALNYAGSPINFRKLHKGATKDFLYTTTGLPDFNDDADAAVHQRLYADPTREITPYFTLPDPAWAQFYLPTEIRLIWPTIGFDAGWPTHFVTAGDAVYIMGTTDSANTYIEIWRMPPSGIWPLTPELIFHVNYLGGSSYRDWNTLLYDPVSTMTGFTLSEQYDVAGNPSDLQTIHLADDADGENGGAGWGGIATPYLSFYPGASLGYSGRTVAQVGRNTRIWRISNDVYGLALINNTTPDPNDQLPDAFFLISGGIETLIYTPTDSTGSLVPNRTIEGQIPRVDPHQPNLVLFMEENRSVSTQQEIKILDMLTGEVTNTKLTAYPTSATFVR